MLLPVLILECEAKFAMVFEQFGQVGRDVFLRFVEPAYNVVADGANRWYFLYLAGAMVVALLIVAYRNADRKKSLFENIRDALPKLFSKDVLLHRSAKLDYRYAIVNHLMTAAVLIYLLLAINLLSGVFYSAIESIALFDNVNVTVGWFGAALIVLLYALAYDTANFFQHIIQHKVPILWEFHKVHHSAEVLTPVTATRLHPVAQMVSATTSAVVYGCLNGLMYNVLAGEAAHYSLFGANLFAVLFYTIGLYHLKHSHVWFTYPRYIKEIFASPSLHIIHHSNNPIHYDKNLGFVFTFWDRVFGTYYDPQDDERHDIKLGISAAEGRDEYCTVSQLYLTPFRRAWTYHLKPALRLIDRESATTSG